MAANAETREDLGKRVRPEGLAEAGEAKKVKFDAAVQNEEKLCNGNEEEETDPEEESENASEGENENVSERENGNVNASEEENSTDNEETAADQSYNDPGVAV